MKNYFKRRITPLLGIVALLAVMGILMAGCEVEVEVTPTTPAGDNPPNTTEIAPYVLTPNPQASWFHGNTSSYSSQIWFAFPIEKDEDYKIEWADCMVKDVLTDKTGDIIVRGRYDNSATLTLIGDDTLPSAFTATHSGYYFLRVSVSLLGRGTFGIRIIGKAPSGNPEPPPQEDGTEAHPYKLTEQDWFDGEITERPASTQSTDVTTGVIWFAFEVTQGSKYTVWWDDSYTSGSGMSTADICVAAKYQGDTTITIFGMGPASQNGSSSSNRGVDTGYTDVSRPNSTFTASKTGTVLVRVLPETANINGVQSGACPGTFGIVYTKWDGDTEVKPLIKF